MASTRMSSLLLVCLCVSGSCLAEGSGTDSVDMAASRHSLDGSIPTPTAVVKTSTGPIRGLTYTIVNADDKKVDVFHAIPYAVPPIGDLRFQPPLYPHATWVAVKETIQPGPSCVQDLKRENIPGVYSEDCLHLNIYAPHSSTNGTTRPVMVWIYGGGFRDGSSVIYEAGILAAQGDVIVVTLNYRIGAFGFLASTASKIIGNMGLMDQTTAMQWVKDNIAQFGGDPQRVTIFGESAGGASVSFHLLSPKSEGYFRSAIAESGSVLCPWAIRTMASAEAAATALAKELDCLNSIGNAVDVDCLRKVPAARLLEAQDVVYATWASENLLNLPFIPVIDGDFLPYDPVTALKGGHFQKSVTVLTGVNHDEWSLFLQGYVDSDHPAINESLFNTSVVHYAEKGFWGFPVGAGANSAVQETLKFTYTDWSEPESDEQRLQQLIKAGSDFAFVCPLIFEIKYRSMSAGNVSNLYMYQFSHTDASHADWMGVPHTAEVFYVFGMPLLLPKKFTEADMQLSRDVMKVWSSFAWTGNPSHGLPEGAAITEWPVYDPKTKQYVDINTVLSVGTHLHNEKCELFARLTPALVNACPGSE